MMVHTSPARKITGPAIRNNVRIEFAPALATVSIQAKPALANYLVA